MNYWLLPIFLPLTPRCYVYALLPRVVLACTRTRVPTPPFPYVTNHQGATRVQAYVYTQVSVCFRTGLSRKTRQLLHTRGSCYRGRSLNGYISERCSVEREQRWRIFWSARTREWIGSHEKFMNIVNPFAICHYVNAKRIFNSATVFEFWYLKSGFTFTNEKIASSTYMTLITNV